MKTFIIRVMTIIIVLSLAACTSTVAGITPSTVPLPTNTLVPPSLTPLPPTPTSTLVPPTLTPVPPTPTPTPKVELSNIGYHSAAYDSGSDRVIVVGGQADSIFTRDAETWTYDIANNTWTNMSPAVSPGDMEGPIAYNSAADRTILFAGNKNLNHTGGSVPGIPLGMDKASRTWAYDFHTNTWMDLKTTGGPSGLLGARMVYDTQSDRMILFGGLQVPLPEDFDLQKFIFHNETWAYDFKKNTWTDMQPKKGPPGRNYFQMTYDTKSDRVLMWGKNILSEGIVWGDDIMWAYDFETNAWTALKSAPAPAIRHYGAMAYASSLDRAFLFGGASPDAGEWPYDDMWSYNDAAQTWEQVRFVSAPSKRGWHTLTYSAKSDRIVLIGGGKDRDHFTNEVWIFDPSATTWTKVKPE